MIVISPGCVITSVSIPDCPSNPNYPSSSYEGSVSTRCGRSCLGGKCLLRQRLLPIPGETSTTALGPEAGARLRAVSETVANIRQRYEITPGRAWRYLHRPMLMWKLSNRPCPGTDGLSHYLPSDLLRGQEKSSLKRIADRNVCIGVDGL